MSRGKSRRVWVACHKWIGLTLGFVLALLGVTGSVNVFTRELDLATHPGFYRATPSAYPVSADVAVAAMEAVEPVRFLRPPDTLIPTWTGLAVARGDLRSVSVDPGTGAVRGVRDIDASLLRMIYELHANLLLERFWGEGMVGVLGLVMLFSTVTGLYLWWPARRFAQALVRLRTRPRQVLYFDLHALAGIWTALVLLMVAATGVGVVFPWMIRPAVDVVSRAALPTAEPPQGRSGPFRIDADRAFAIAHRAAPAEDVSYAWVPTRAHPFWQIGLRWRGVNAAYLNAGEISIDPWTGALLRNAAARVQTRGQRFMDMQLWMHNGAVWGWPGRIAVFASGVSLAMLYVTGVLFWLRKAAVRRRKRLA